jgi:hypothetical protein
MFLMRCMWSVINCSCWRQNTNGIIQNYVTWLVNLFQSILDGIRRQWRRELGRGIGSG